MSSATAEIAGLTGRRIIAMAFDAMRQGQVDWVSNTSAQELDGLQILANSASLPAGSFTARSTGTGAASETLSPTAPV